MLDELLSLFANRTRSLEMLYLINDLKKAVRLDASENELIKIKGFCEKNDLHCEVSDFKVIKQTDEGKGSFSNLVVRVPSSHPSRGLYHLYISKDKNKAAMLKLVENKQDDEAVGTLLGYPPCCIDFFRLNKTPQQKVQNDYVMPALHNSEGFQFPFYNNIAARYFDCTLLSHFPHNFECNESLKQGKERLEFLKEHDPELAAEMEKILKNPILYTEKQGIFMFENSGLDQFTLAYDSIRATIENELYQRLQQEKKIIIISSQRIKVGTEIIEDIGMMVFI